MGKDKLRKFREIEQMSCVIEPSAEEARLGLVLKGNCTLNDHGLVLELGCGKGEYTVELARRNLIKTILGSTSKALVCGVEPKPRPRKD